jgi:hypothetical protein
MSDKKKKTLTVVILLPLEQGPWWRQAYSAIHRP